MSPLKQDHPTLDAERRWAQQMRWIPVAEELPDDNETVLLVVDGEPWTGYHEAEQWFYISGDCLGSKVTHWMPFPDPPEE